MSDKEQKYFNVPVQLLNGFMVDTGTTLDNIFDFAVYSQSQKLNGTKIQKFDAALNWYHVTTGNKSRSIDNGERLVSKYTINSPKVGINKDVFFDYYKNYKTDFEKACLLAYLALKSIVQNKPYACIGNAFWLARMDGKVNAVKDFSELSGEIRKFANEYQTVKLKRELRDAWNLKFYSYHLRGCYYSFTLPLEDLILQAEKTRKKNKQIAARKITEQAREAAIKKLNIK